MSRKGCPVFTKSTGKATRWDVEMWMAFLRNWAPPQNVSIHSKRMKHDCHFFLRHISCSNRSCVSTDPAGDPCACALGHSKDTRAVFASRAWFQLGNAQFPVNEAECGTRRPWRPIKFPVVSEAPRLLMFRAGLPSQPQMPAFC